MNREERNPNNIDDNMMVILKGAPERVLNRCSHIMIDGKECPMTKEEKDDIERANNNFGDDGERVLAIAIKKLDTETYKKTPSYKFDMKGWKTF